MASIGCVSYYSFKAVLTLVFLTFVVVAIPAAGGIFNRMRGGGIVDWSSLNETYWTSHLTGRAVMAVPTALLLVRNKTVLKILDVMILLLLYTVHYSLWASCVNFDLSLLCPADCGRFPF